MLFRELWIKIVSLACNNAEIYSIRNIVTAKWFFAKLLFGCSIYASKEIRTNQSGERKTDEHPPKEIHMNQGLGWSHFGLRADHALQGISPKSKLTSQPDSGYKRV